MNFKELLNCSVTETSYTASMPAAHNFLSIFYTATETCPADMFQLLASGTNLSDIFFCLSLCPVDAFLLIHTRDGKGKIKTGGQAFDLPEKSLFILDCSQHFSIQPAILPWNFQIFFISRSFPSVYAPILFPDAHPMICQADFHSPALHLLNMLLAIPEQYSLSDAFSMHRYITDLFCILCQQKIPQKPAEASADLPFYLADMKQRLEKYFSHPFSLSDYEQYYKISKYRLCREFSAQFGIPPLQFLNQKRIAAAKEMLLTTDLSIHEISSAIGYESPTHFINLFRKQTQITPGAFRQVMQDKNR